MKVESHINGDLQILLAPENNLDKAVLEEFEARTKLGKKVTVSGEGSTDGSLLRLKITVGA